MSKKETYENLSYEEVSQISKNLIQHHGVFYKFWQLVRPKYVSSKAYPTACVVFNKENECIDFLINKKFWNKISETQRAFVVSHECLHVMLEHGKRACSNMAKLNPSMVNACLDIPINETLVKYFDFSRKTVDPKSKFCWADTVFEKGTPKDKSYEFYFNKFKNDPETKEISLCGMGSGKSGDDELESSSHENLNSFNENGSEQQIEDLIDSLSEEQKESLKDIAERFNKSQNSKDPSDQKIAGEGSDNLMKIIGKIKAKPKKKWETVIRKWSQKITKQTKDELNWIIKNRRNNLLSYNDLFLPSDMEQDMRRSSGDKIDVWMFLDTSGSCIDLAPRFWKAAKSLPKEKFNVKYHCFDTEVFELNEEDVKDGKLYGFKGTSFVALERFIQKTITKEKKRYSNIGAVFVITDGWGDAVKHENARKWYWFLSEDYKTYIPKESQYFLLKDFE